MTLSDRDALLRPLVSLIAKSEKALLKLAPGGWQHTMLSQNIHALRLAIRLLDGDIAAVDTVVRDESLSALEAFAKMIEKTEKALAKFTPGTSQQTLLQNRLKALRCAEDAIHGLLSED